MSAYNNISYCFSKAAQEDCYCTVVKFTVVNCRLTGIAVVIRGQLCLYHVYQCAVYQYYVLAELSSHVQPYTYVTLRNIIVPRKMAALFLLQVN